MYWKSELLFSFTLNCLSFCFPKLGGRTKKLKPKTNKHPTPPEKTQNQTTKMI